MKIMALVMAFGIAIASVSTPVKSDTTGIKVGILKCHQIKGSRVNLLIHSTAQITCLFTSLNGEREAIYRGETGIGLGIDLNWNKSETINFVVLGVSTDIDPDKHPLSGKYIGAKASASAGIGMGVQMLVGAGANQFTLQPLGFETSTGFGIAAGLGYLYLEAAR
jgi:hypothetical protein